MVQYLTFLRHAEKVTKGAGKERPLFKGVYHNNGYVYVTDTFRLYKAKSEYAIPDGSLIDPGTGSEIDGSFPDVDNVIPNNSPIVTVTVNVKHMIDVLKALQQAGRIPLEVGGKKERKADVIFRLKVENGVATFSTRKHKVSAKYETDATDSKQQSLELGVNSEYLIQALELVRDTLGISEAGMELHGETSPIVLKYKDTLTVLVLPVRINE